MSDSPPLVVASHPLVDPDSLTSCNTLVCTLVAVPQLAQACISALVTQGDSGSGLKTMRLVDKSIKTAMVSMIRGFTLYVNCIDEGRILESGLLEGVQLSRLRVLLTRESGPAETSYGVEHMSKLGKLVLLWSNILCTVTSVELGTSPLQDSPLEALGKTYMLLAEACPDLQHLHVDGNLPRLVLGHFGERCSKLTSLEVERVCDGAFLELQLLLPNLTHIKVLQPGRDAPTQPSAQRPARSDTAFAHRSICELSNCSALTSLHVGLQKLSHEVWCLLPRSLKALHASLECPPPIDMDAFPALQHMHIHCIEGATLKLQYLTALVRAAPNLHTLTMPPHSPNTAVQMECVPEVLPDLVYLEGRFQGGLRTHLQLDGEGGAFGEIPISFDRVMGVVGAEDSSIADFLTNLPCLPALHSIRIEYASSSPQSRHKDMQQVARAFPNLGMLVLNGKLCDADIIPLAACKKLSKLVLFWTRVTPIGLAVFCCHLPTLRMLASIEPTQGMKFHGVALTELLREWGLTTMVCVIAKQ